MAIPHPAILNRWVDEKTAQLKVDAAKRESAVERAYTHLREEKEALAAAGAK